MDSVCGVEATRTLHVELLSGVWVSHCLGYIGGECV